MAFLWILFISFLFLDGATVGSQEKAETSMGGVGLEEREAEAR